jgi:hypothetical protein
MKQKTLKKLADKIIKLENNIYKSYQVEESQKEIEKIMSSLSMEEMFQLDDYIFTNYKA